LYTPLEQYGGDGGHTSAKSDIYALGATFYHLMTSQPPPEAKARFLDPNALTPPELINPAISPVVADAVQWAMAMHPDDRPDDVQALGAALIADKVVARGNKDSAETLRTALYQNRTLVIVAATLLIIAVLITIL
jgi:serine/threonine-protein kinase